MRRATVSASGRRRALIAFVVVILLASWGLAANRPALAATPSDRAITLSFLGSDTREIPAGWTVTACPRGAEPDLVTLTCDNGEITFTATDFDRGQGKQKVTVAFTVAGQAKTTVYTVSLEAPELQIPASTTYRYPLPQGTPTTVPWTALRYTCQSCASASPQFRSGSVSPSRAGTVRFSGTGVVFSPAPDFSGRATLHYRLRDRFGQQTSKANVKVTVVPGRSHAPTMVATSVAAKAVHDSSATVVRATGNAMKQDIVEKTHPAILTSCGTPFHGTVTCTMDGSFVYTPAKGFSGVDEFGYHVFTRSSGDQAVGTVLVAVGANAASRASAAVEAGPASHRVPVIAPLQVEAG
ncbi:hypothetical protein AX769_13830 [Frondihabitans sp. PAMC 28766]|uniref:Ig-like domain-containing protein n=1 Tax=Frondihabitans sp. PAMC 28766 TaxID=1795630 RepID=UPI00078BEE43|nr:Ig-like domain-containing protein [Frondihabitans sp. PAMC 28766]AMM21014.1 hypothetical protein AX769_13830 [Frondihabitans sp. PAMC 28766]